MYCCLKWLKLQDAMAIYFHQQVTTASHTACGKEANKTTSTTKADKLIVHSMAEIKP